MTRVRYGDLTSEERALLTNGCGGKGSWIRVPDLEFGDACDHHDFNYWIGGKEADRVKADWQFYEAMIEAANRTGWLLRPFARFRAWAYYRAVRRFAAGYFHYGPARTREDLDAELEKASANA